MLAGSGTRRRPGGGRREGEWSAAAYRGQEREDAWHFAYPVQSWAAEQSGHVVMIPARSTIVADRGFFSEEFSHIPVRALRGVRADDPDQIVVVTHMWTTEQVEAFVKANPGRWMANPYVGASPQVSLEAELAGLAARRLDGTSYFYRDDAALEEERETFEALTSPADPRQPGSSTNVLSTDEECATACWSADGRSSRLRPRTMARDSGPGG